MSEEIKKEEINKTTIVEENDPEFDVDQYLREEFLYDNFHEHANAATLSLSRYRSRNYNNLVPNSRQVCEQNIANLLTDIALLMKKNIIDGDRVIELVNQHVGSLNHDMENLWIKNIGEIKIHEGVTKINFAKHVYDPEAVNAEMEKMKKEQEEAYKKAMENGEIQPNPWSGLA